MPHLVLQSPALQPADTERIAAIACAQGVQDIGNTAVRLIDVDMEARAEIVALCEQLRLDHAFLDEIRPLTDCRILAMDMDSTLINIECIDEMADLVGKKAEVAAITEAAMRGEITDFAESLRRRVALLEGAPVDVLQRVYDERLRLNPGAARLVRMAKSAGLTVLLVSGGFTFFTERLQQRLSLDLTRSNTLEIENGRLTGRVLGGIVDARTKADALGELAASLDARPEQIIAIGDGANDLKMMALAHYSVAWRAKPVVREQTRYALDFSPLDAVLNWFRSGRHAGSPI